MHYTAAHYYDPNKAAFQDFEPFWEFVSGPDPCRHLRPERPRHDFRPRSEVRQGPRAGQVNLPPSAGLQFFGHVKIAADTGGNDRDAPRRRRRGPVVDRPRAAPGLIGGTPPDVPMQGFGRATALLASSMRSPGRAYRRSSPLLYRLLFMPARNSGTRLKASARAAGLSPALALPLPSAVKARPCSSWTGCSALSKSW